MVIFNSKLLNYQRVTQVKYDYSMYILDVSPTIVKFYNSLIGKSHLSSPKKSSINGSFSLTIRGILRTISSTKSPFLGGSAASPSGKRTANAQVDVTWRCGDGAAWGWEKVRIFAKKVDKNPGFLGKNEKMMVFET